jgi:hypothetical protein
MIEVMLLRKHSSCYLRKITFLIFLKTLLQKKLISGKVYILENESLHLSGPWGGE